MQRNVDEIRRVRGVPHINHPNFRWPFSTEDLRQVRNMRQLEILTVIHRSTTSARRRAGLEEVWDAILSSGTLCTGLRSMMRTRSNSREPGGRGPRAWLGDGACRAPRGARILQALEDRRFYSSTASSSPATWSRGVGWRHREEGRVGEDLFIHGRGGRAAEALDSRADYVFTAMKVRAAKVIESKGGVACGQPVLLR